nr:nucleoside-triphosphatase [uncultured Holophaga sp.]
MTFHLFLTGSIQVGKSTLLDRVLARLGRPLGGFRTFGTPRREDGTSDVCLRGVGVEVGAHRVAIRGGERPGFEAYPEVFDEVGAPLLDRPLPQEAICVMDELGFMESGALAFQEAVLRRLDGDLPVFGVIKPRAHPFLDRVRAHPKVQVLAVDPGNRDDLADLIQLIPVGFRIGKA